MDNRVEGIPLFVRAINSLLVEKRAAANPDDAEDIAMLEELRRRLLAEQGGGPQESI